MVVWGVGNPQMSMWFALISRYALPANWSDLLHATGISEGPVRGHAILTCRLRVEPHSADRARRPV